MNILEGNKIVCHTAKWLSVEVHRDGKIYSQHFESTDDGATAKTQVLSEDDPVKPQITGTKIVYVPDEKVYGEVFIDLPKLRNMLKEISYFTKGLKILLINDGQEEVFYSEHGLIDGLKNEKAISEPFSYFYETDDCKVELALQWVPSGGNVKGYANGLYMPDGGAFITGFKSSLTRTFNSLANKNFTGEQIRGVLDGFVSVKVRMGQFSNQAKTALANPEARTATSSAISLALKEFSQRRVNEFNKVIELLTKVEKAEAAAARARENILNATKDIEKNQKKKVFASDKLKDAEFLGEDSILLLVEGNSAASSMAMARNIKNTGILGLRGKCINTFTNPDDKIYENEEMKLLLSAMNITPGRYNSKKLRYGRAAICTDGDSDGYSIGLLIMCAFYKFAPEFIEEGRLCWLRAPLYIIKTKNKDYYYYSDEEFNNSSIKGEVIRIKGLGALSAEQAHNSMFTEEFRRLDTLIPDNNSYNLLSDLMGNDSSKKRKFIFSNIDFNEIKE